MPNRLLTIKEVTRHFLREYKKASKGLTDKQKRELLLMTFGGLMYGPMISRDDKRAH